jgi:septum formation protein
MSLCKKKGSGYPAGLDAHQDYILYQQNKRMGKVILASASPRRKELLEQLLGGGFDVCISSYDERPVEGFTPEELAVHHSLEKARDVASHLQEGLVISADTFVVCSGEVLGKPTSESMAKETLQKISGQKIRVITGVTLLDIGRGLEISECETTLVFMKDLSPREIDCYIDTREPFGKAGAFAIQGKGALFVERIEGDYFNIVGLPLFRLGMMLEQMHAEYMLWGGKYP